MKLTRQSVIAASSLIIGGIIGASALVALADNTWVGAPGSPSNCDSSISGCNPPINVGSYPQTKTGLLSLGYFQFDPAGATITPGSTLTAADTNGTVQWSEPGVQTITSYGTVTWDMFNVAGASYFGCTTSTSPNGFCSGSITYAVQGSTYHPLFGCTNGYQLSSYFTGVEGGFSNHIIHYKGYCVKSVNVN